MLRGEDLASKHGVDVELIRAHNEALNAKGFVDRAVDDAQRRHSRALKLERLMTENDDLEIQVIRLCVESLNRLDRVTASRVLSYLEDRFDA